MRLRCAPWTYRLLTHAAALPAGLYTAWRAGRDGGLDYLLQRYACRMPGDAHGRIVLHCCSVGEVRAALPLARQLQAGGQALLLSVATPTGRRMAHALLAEVPCVYFPLDHVSVVRRWLQRLQPRAMVLMETELWPNFYAVAHAAGIPLALANARLSPRTEAAPAWLRPALQQAVQRLHCVLARGQEDADRFAAFGMPPERIRNLGNIKYATVPAAVPDTAPIPRPYVLAASTHADEEAQLADIWRRLDADGHVLAILPRYPHRAARLRKRLSAPDLRIGLHSRDRKPRHDDRIYLVDTLAEAPWWMRHAAFVFMGGSLIPRGGHNVLEPAMLGKACAIGPHTRNFRTEVQELQHDGGLQQVQSLAELEALFARWLAHPKQAEQVGTRARAHVRRHHHIAQQYVEALRDYDALPA